ncbi:MAG: 50S ribosomal protein L13 [Balneolaceae bacterium]
MHENNEIVVNTISNKTYSAKAGDIKKKWVLVDASEQPLGRVASRIASILRGKHKPQFTPHMDTGDNVVVINSGNVVLTGKKWSDKSYFRHTGYTGSEQFIAANQMHEKDPTALIYNAVKGMLPRNRLGRKLMTNLRIYAGPEHDLTAQQPEKIEL